MRAGAPRRPGRIGEGCGRSAQLLVSETDRILRARQSGEAREPAYAAATLPHPLVRTSTCASNMNSKPRWDGDICRRVVSIVLTGIGASVSGSTYRYWRSGPRQQLRLFLLAGIGFARFIPDASSRRTRDRRFWLPLEP